MSRVRAVAVRVLRDAERGRRFVDDVLDEARQEALSSRDRAFLTHVVYGVTRHRRTLDHLLRKISGVHDFDSQVLQTLRIGLYEIHFLRTAPHAAVDEAVELAKGVSRKSGNFVNAVLRKAIAADREKLIGADWGVRYSYPTWLVERWKRIYGDRTVSILEAGNAILPITARVNRLRTAPLRFPRGHRPESVVLDGPIGELPELREGLVTVQDETAMSVAPLVEPEGKHIIDLCASPGGKATHLAELRGRVVAVDLSLEKIRLVRESAQRLGLTISLVVADGRHFAGRFDAALVDAPCSNTGVLARRADARWRLREIEIASAVGIQQSLLENAATLAPRIVYSTCSIEPEENEERVDEFLASHRGWTCDHRELILPGPTAAGGFAARLIRS